MSYKNTFGHLFKVHTFGESHGEALGGIIDGCPAGLDLNEDKIKIYLNRRRPGQNEYVTARSEKDQYKILSGVYLGKTLGTPLAYEFLNSDQRSVDYENKPARRGHADQVWVDKYGHTDPRGGGRSSGRETVSRVFAGAVARQLLEKYCPELKICVWIESVGQLKSNLEFSEFKNKFETYAGLQCELGFPDIEQLQSLKDLLLEAKANGESYGGVVKIKIVSAPVGLGQPVFSKLKSDLASALFSLGATQGVILGDEHVHRPGSEFHKMNSPYGGIQGGISTGEDIDLKVLMKPTSSVGSFSKEGRHDPCILPRALVVLESMVGMVLLDHFMLKSLDRLKS